jgi:hypothetical protein
MAIRRFAGLLTGAVAVPRWTDIHTYWFIRMSSGVKAVVEQYAKRRM